MRFASSSSRNCLWVGARHLVVLVVEWYTRGIGLGDPHAAHQPDGNAARDGSVIALVENGPPLAPLFGVKEARYDATKFNWLGTPSVETAMVLIGKAVPVFSLDDLRTRETVMGASGANSTPAFFARLFNATLGTRMKIIPGYPGQNDALVAMERASGSVSEICLSGAACTATSSAFNLPICSPTEAILPFSRAD